MDGECKIAFHLGADNNANVEIVGSHSDIVFCLVGLTVQICNELNIPPRLFAEVLPELMEDHQKQIQQTTKTNRGDISKTTGGGTP